ncbi:eukaryotic translation initiation factor 3 subunit M-like, partial [Scleropages formosus]
ASELRAYIKSKGAEISEENSEGGPHVDLAQIIDTDKQEALIESLCEKLVKFREGERPSLRMQLEAAAKVMVELLGSYTEDNASQARVDAHRCIVSALKDPDTFLFDHLLILKPVCFLEGELIHDLLTIFVSAKLATYVKFYQNNKDFVDSLGLSHDQNMAKMRLLTFMGMAVEYKEISLDTMQQELQIGTDEVEAFVIDAVRTKMVYCKIDQTQRKVVVSHSTHRTFGKQQWQQLYDSLSAWKQNLAAVKTSLQALTSST